MEGSLENSAREATKKYLALVSIIEQIQYRLQFSEFMYILLNAAVFFPSIFFVSYVYQKPECISGSLCILFVLFSFVIGIMINTYWVISSIRLQLKLKLRYFQARNLERKYNESGEFFMTDEARYFDPKIGRVDSFDGQETIYYPKEGALRMDGFIGSAKPRHLSLMIPLVFFLIYIVSFYSIAYVAIH